MSTHGGKGKMRCLPVPGVVNLKMQPIQHIRTVRVCLLEWISFIWNFWKRRAPHSCTMSDTDVFSTVLRAAFALWAFGICFLLHSIEKQIVLISMQFLPHMFFIHSLAGLSPWNVLRALWNSALGGIKTTWILRTMKAAAQGKQWRNRPEKFLAILLDKAISELSGGKPRPKCKAGLEGTPTTLFNQMFLQTCASSCRKEGRRG